MTDIIGPTILVIFEWNQVTPDNRPYKPSAPIFNPVNVTVGINVPLNSEFILNASEVIAAQIASGNGTVPQPILTPTGVRFCVDQLEASMSMNYAAGEEESQEKSKSTKDDGWDDNDTAWTDDDEKTSTKSDDDETSPNWDDDAAWGDK